MIKGRIVKIESKNYYVQLKNKDVVICSLRGRFKRAIQHKKDKLTTLDLAVVGDWVSISKIPDGRGVIEEVDERKNYLSRKAIKARGSLRRGNRLEQIIASNIDRLYIVKSINEPGFNNRFLDRAIVAAESSGIQVSIIINKVDLDKNRFAEKWEQLYSKIGYKVYLTSANENIGIDNIKINLNGKVNIFWGQSGVGKSTILNILYPQLNFEVGEISNSTNKGMHTTVTAVMQEVERDTFIIDTPGVRELDPFGLEKKDVGHYFKEFLPYLNDCKFNTCIHKLEPGCAISKAVYEGKITEERYRSYLNIIETIEEDMYY